MQQPCWQTVTFSLVLGSLSLSVVLSVFCFVSLWILFSQSGSLFPSVTLFLSHTHSLHSICLSLSLLSLSFSVPSSCNPSLSLRHTHSFSLSVPTPFYHSFLSLSLCLSIFLCLAVPPSLHYSSLCLSLSFADVFLSTTKK